MAGTAPKYLIGAVVAIGVTALIAWKYTPQAAPRMPVADDRQAALAVAKTLLGADSIFDRFLAAGTLLEAGDRTGYEILAEGLVSQDPTVARAAMDTLLSVPDFCALAQTIEDISERPMLNEALLRGIAYFSRQDALPYVRDALDSPIPTVRIRALRTVARLHDGQSLPHVQNSLETRGMMDDERANVYYALTALGDGVARQDDIIELTRNSETSVREVAAITLGNIPSDRSRAALALLVDDQSVRVRVAALGSHVNVGGEQSVEALEDVITTGHRDHAIIAAAALKRVPASIAQGVIKRVTGCCELKAEVAMRLMETWGRIGGGDGTDLTVPGWGLRHGDLDVRLQTLWALGWRADQGFRDLILPYLKDPDPAMRGMAAWAVARLGLPVNEATLELEDGQTPVCPAQYRHRDEFEDVEAAAISENSVGLAPG